MHAPNPYAHIAMYVYMHFIHIHTQTHIYICTYMCTCLCKNWLKIAATATKTQRQCNNYFCLRLLLIAKVKITTLLVTFCCDCPFTLRCLILSVPQLHVTPFCMCVLYALFIGFGPFGSCAPPHHYQHVISAALRLRCRCFSLLFVLLLLLPVCTLVFCCCCCRCFLFFLFCFVIGGQASY